MQLIKIPVEWRRSIKFCTENQLSFQITKRTLTPRDLNWITYNIELAESVIKVFFYGWNKNLA